MAKPPDLLRTTPTHHILSLEGHMGAHRTFESNFSTTGPFHISRCPQSLWFLESLDPIFLEDFLKRFLEKEGVEGRSLLTRRVESIAEKSV